MDESKYKLIFAIIIILFLLVISYLIQNYFPLLFSIPLIWYLYYDNLQIISGGDFENQLSDIKNNILQITNQNFSIDNFITNLKRNINYDVPCGDDYTDVNYYLYKNNLQAFCIFASKDTKLYKFKSGLKDLMTTEYIRSMAEKQNKYTTMEILKYFNDVLDIFMSYHNQRSSPKLDHHTLTILYKGGNMINFYIKYFINTLLDQVKKNKNPSTYVKIQQYLYKLNNELKRGDWDYTLHIDKRYVSQLDQQSYRRLLDAITTLILFALQKLKEEIADLLSLDYHSLAKSIQTVFNENNENFINIIQSYGKNVYIQNIKIPGYEITPKDIIPLNNNNVVDVKSSIIIPRQNEPVNDNFQTDSFIENANVPAFQLIENNIFINYIQNIKFIRGRYHISFNLARLKANNIVNLIIDGELSKNNIPAELVDVSFINADDNLQHKIYERLQQYKAEKYFSAQYKNHNFTYYSVEYLYVDLYMIIIEQSLFVWLDKKYKKRIHRLISLGIICGIKNSNIREINNDMLEILNILKNSSNKSMSLENKKGQIEHLFNITTGDSPQIIISEKYKINKYLGDILIIYYKYILIILDSRSMDLSNSEKQYVDYVSYPYKNLEYLSEFKNLNEPYKKIINSNLESDFNKFVDVVIEKYEEYYNLLNGVDFNFLDINNKIYDYIL